MSTWIYRALLAVVMVCTQVCMSAQEGVYYTIDESDGLPSNYVYRVFEDSKGYIWIATEEGAARYDGHTMKVYNTSNGLANNDVYKIFEDECDRIWFITMSSDLNFIKDDSLHTVRTGSRYRMSDFWSDSVDTRFVSESNQNNQSFSIPCDFPKSPPRLLDAGYRPSFIPLSKTRTFFQGQESVKLLDENNSILSECSKPIIRSTVNYVANGIGVYNILNERGLVILNMAKDTLFEVVFKEGITSHADQFVVQWNQRSQTFQLNVNNFIYIYDRGFQILDRIELPELLLTAIASYYVDSANNLWVSTNEGVRLYPKMNRYLEVSKVDHQGLNPSPRLAKIVFHGQTIYLVSETASVYKYDAEARAFEVVYETSSQKNSIYSAYLINDTLWYSTQREGLLVLDLSDPKKFNKAVLPVLRSFCKDGDFQPENKMKNFALSNGSKLAYGGTRFGIVDFVKRSTRALGEFDVIAVAFDGEDIWAAEPSKVLVYSNVQDCHPLVNEISFATCDFIYAYADRTLIANQQGVLLECIDMKCDTVGKLSGGSIVKAFELETELVLSTSSHMYRYEGGGLTSSLEEILNYQSLGQAIDVRDIVLINGIFYYATNRGLITSKRKEAIVNVPEVILYIESHNDPKYIYDYDHDPLQIRFSTSYISDVEPVIYEYKLEGLNTDYTLVEGRTVTYQKLPKGDYTFILQASLPNGKVLDRASFDIQIKPAWWNTIWFYFLALFLGLGSIVLILRYHVLRLKKKAAVDQQFAELELNALQSQMSPHFMFNTMNSLQNLVASGQTEEADKYISKFASVLRKYLEISRSKFIPLEVEMEVTKLYLELEALRFGGRFRFYIDNKLSSREYSHLVPATLIQPFAENALVHGLFHKKGSGNILIKLFSVEDLIHVEIIDNGVGRAKADQRKKQRSVVHESRGQEIIKDRLALIEKLNNFQIRYSITDLYDGEVSLGTKVSIVIRTNEKYEGSYS